MWGLMGFGINWMNVYMVCQVMVGLVKLMISLGEEMMVCGVVIFYDFWNNFCFFVYEVVWVLGVQGIKIYIYDDLCLMLELFFVVWYLYIYVGIMIMVSYNLKEYNGYKIYGEDGGQMLLKELDMMIGYIC